MKKIIFLICILSSTTTIVSAQDRPMGGGQGRGANREAARQMIKDELKLTDMQADSLMAMQQEFQMQNRSIMTNSSLTEDEKKMKMKELEVERKMKMRTLLNEKQIKKLDAYYENMRQMRGQRQWQGNVNN